jgi:hypothetical protein
MGLLGKERDRRYIVIYGYYCSCFFNFIFIFFNNNQYQNIFIFFTFYITSIIFYYYSNKKIQIFLLFYTNSFYFISHHHFLLILKLTIHYSVLYVSLPNTRSILGFFSYFVPSWTTIYRKNIYKESVFSVYFAANLLKAF